MASAFTSLDVNDTFLSVTVAHAEQALTLPTELSVYVRLIVNMHPASPSPSDDSSNGSSMPPLMDPRSLSSSDSSITRSDDSDKEPGVFGSPNGPGIDGRRFGHSSEFAAPDPPMTKFELNNQPSIDIFGRLPLHISVDGDLNGPLVFYVPDPNDLDALTFINVEGTALAGGKAAVNPNWELLDSQSTCDMFCNKHLLKYIQRVPHFIKAHSQAGTLRTNLVALKEGHGWV